jgi:hypothetical protein
MSLLHAAAFALASICLAGCGATRQEVVARLGEQYIGQNVDVLVTQFGPPANSFKMNSGGSSYVWQLAATTDVAVDRGYGSINTRVCKVSVITDPKGTVTQLNTEDSNASTGVYGAMHIGGTICSQRLGIKSGA